MTCKNTPKVLPEDIAIVIGEFLHPKECISLTFVSKGSTGNGEWIQDIVRHTKSQYGPDIKERLLSMCSKCSTPAIMFPDKYSMYEWEGISLFIRRWQPRLCYIHSEYSGGLNMGKCESV